MHRELMALRISSSNASASPAVADWPSAPPEAHGIVQLKGGRRGGDLHGRAEVGAWLLSSTSLFWVTVPAISKPQNTDEFRAAAMPTFHRIELTSSLSLRHLAVSESGELLALIGQNKSGGGWQLAWADCGSATRCVIDVVVDLPHGAVKDVACGGTYMYVATALGLWRADTTLRKVEASPIYHGIMRTVAASGARLAVATEAEMVESTDSGKTFSAHPERYPMVGTLLDAPATGLTFAGDELWVAMKPAIAMVHESAYTRIGAADGLPYNNTQTITTGCGKIWMGSDKGVVVRDLATSEWQYLYGPRWHPGSAVHTIAAIPGPATATDSTSGVMMLGTDAGLSIIWVDDTWTLERKAVWYAPVMQRHDRSGLLSDCTLKDPGNRSSCSLHDSDNDGLWTSLNVAGETFRYAVQQTPEAKKSAWKHFEGLLLLNSVTGIKGLMARSLVKVVNMDCQSGPCDQEHVWPKHDPPTQKGARPCNWVNSSSHPDLKWKCDTSNDEVVGHYFAYLTVAELLAETAEEKEIVRSLVDNITSTIVANNYTLVDITGKVTTWGNFDPVEITGFLLAAHRITGKQEYLDALEPLLQKTGDYAIGFPTAIANGQIAVPESYNFSDDELDFLAFWNLLMGAVDNNSTVVQVARRGIARSWDIIAKERAGFWNTMALAALMKTGGIPAAPRGIGRTRDPAAAVQDTLWNLRTWPLEWVEWATNNTHRLDVYYQKDSHSRDHGLLVTPLPNNERNQVRRLLVSFRAKQQTRIGSAATNQLLIDYSITVLTAVDHSDYSARSFDGTDPPTRLVRCCCTVQSLTSHWYSRESRSSVICCVLQ